MTVKKLTYTDASSKSEQTCTYPCINCSLASDDAHGEHECTHEEASKAKGKQEELSHGIYLQRN
jgi:hypothetical protein